MGNVLTLTPPLVVTEAEMMQALDIVDEAVRAG
jgi:4-aminobutyrate aminotransferase